MTEAPYFMANPKGVQYPAGRTRDSWQAIWDAMQAAPDFVPAADLEAAALALPEPLALKSVENLIVRAWGAGLLVKVKAYEHNQAPVAYRIAHDAPQRAAQAVIDAQANGGRPVTKRGQTVYDRSVPRRRDISRGTSGPVAQATVSSVADVPAPLAEELRQQGRDEAENEFVNVRMEVARLRQEAQDDAAVLSALEPLVTAWMAGRITDKPQEPHVLAGVEADSPMGRYVARVMAPMNGRHGVRMTIGGGYFK